MEFSSGYSNYKPKGMSAEDWTKTKKYKEELTIDAIHEIEISIAKCTLLHASNLSKIMKKFDENTDASLFDEIVKDDNKLKETVEFYENINDHIYRASVNDNFRNNLRKMNTFTMNDLDDNKKKKDRNIGFVEMRYNYYKKRINDFSECIENENSDCSEIREQLKIHVIESNLNWKII